MVHANTDGLQRASQYIAEPACFQVGGTGKLYKARHRETKNLVAIKVISLHTPALRQTFENERLLLSKMEHSRFTTSLREFFVYNGRGYLVMELLHQDLFTRSETLHSVDEIRSVFHKSCQAVQELHHHNIAHLDLKPENFLLDTKDNVKLCDLGGSFMWKTTPTFFGFVGSDFYLAPEVFSHKQGYDACKADVWSMGIMLHVLLIGSFPFEGESREEALASYFSAKTSFRELQNSDCDPSCLELVSSMLDMNPELRPNMSEVLRSPWFLQREESFQT
jgi:serine/threonine protein kinase